MRKRAIVTVGIAAAIVVSPAVPADAAGAKTRPKAAGLKAFGSCNSLVRYARRNAARTLEPELIGPVRGRRRGRLPLMDFGGQGQVVAGAPAGSKESSATNVQEAGVDEPDIVKTDGARIFAVARGSLHAVDVSGAAPIRVGALRLPRGGFSHELLLRGNRLLVATSTEASTVLSEVDVSVPAAMRVVRTLTVDGDFVSARLTGGTARVVISTSPPALDLPYPTGQDIQAVRRKARHNRATVRRARLGRWVPSYVLRDKRTTRKATKRLVPCRAVRRASVFSGLDMLTVLTIDLDKGLPPVDSDALMTDAENVYASTQGLYVATRRLIDEELPSERQGRGTTTQIHKFDISTPNATSYRASGAVRGFLLNQFAMSEYQGHLRVASTSEPVELEGGRDGDSESFVTVLAERGGTLPRVGGVRGLGHGERIYSVRFIEDKGYVVTYREVDPLYTLDLSTPTAPHVLGELKIRGYSAYLHPAENDLLIGVGQDATRRGRTLGTQISLFDVSDLRSPRRLHSRTVASGSWSEVEYDHHAFLYWAPAKLAVLPVDASDSRERSLFSGAMGFRLGRDSGIAESFRISHGTRTRPVPVRRSLVVGDTLYTLSDTGLASNSLSTFRGLGFVDLSR